MNQCKYIVLIILAVLMIQSCRLNDTSDDGLFCTDEFVMFSLTVNNPDGGPAEAVEIEVRNKQTGNLYDICEVDLCNTFEPGKYVIMHDGFLGEISTRSENIIVSGIKEDLSFKEEFTFRSGSCHVEKISGPDMVTLS